MTAGTRERVGQGFHRPSGNGLEDACSIFLSSPAAHRYVDADFRVWVCDPQMFPNSAVGRGAGSASGGYSPPPSALTWKLFAANLFAPWRFSVPAAGEESPQHAAFADVWVNSGYGFASVVPTVHPLATVLAVVPCLASGARKKAAVMGDVVVAHESIRRLVHDTFEKQ